MATAVIPIVLKLEEELLPEEIVLVKEFIGLFHRKGNKQQTISVQAQLKGTADPWTLSSTSLDPDSPYATST